MYIVTARQTPLGVSIEKTDSLSWKKEIWHVHSDLWLKIPSWNLVGVSDSKLPLLLQILKEMSKLASNCQSFCKYLVKKYPNFLILFLFVSMKLDIFRMIFSKLDHCGLRATFDIKESFLLQPKTWHGHRLHCVSSRAWLAKGRGCHAFLVACWGTYLG